MVIKKIRIVFSILLMVLGTAHTCFTLVFYPALNLAALWFAGAGLAFLFLGLLNLSENTPFRRWFAWAKLGANMLGMLYVIAVAWKLPEPQAFIGVLFTAVLTVCAFLEIRPKS